MIDWMIRRCYTMRTIFAECNPHRNSIDVYWLYAPHWLLGSWEGLKNHAWIRLCIRCTCYWWTTGICKIISWWKFANVDRCRRFIRNFLIFKQIQQFKSLLATIFPENSSLVCVNAKKGRVKLSTLRRLFSFAVVRQMVSVVSYWLWL